MPETATVPLVDPVVTLSITKVSPSASVSFAKGETVTFWPAQIVIASELATGALFGGTSVFNGSPALTWYPPVTAVSSSWLTTTYKVDSNSDLASFENT